MIFLVWCSVLSLYVLSFFWEGSEAYLSMVIVFFMEMIVIPVTALVGCVGLFNAFMKKRRDLLAYLVGLAVLVTCYIIRSSAIK